MNAFSRRIVTIAVYRPIQTRMFNWQFSYTLKGQINLTNISGKTKRRTVTPCFHDASFSVDRE